MHADAGPVLVVAAHPDDEVLGVGGTLARHAAQGDAVYVALLSDGESARFPKAPERIVRRQTQALQAAEILGIKEVFFGNFPDQQLDVQPFLQVTNFIAELVRQLTPRTVYTHHYTELNRDHRIAYEATIVAVRPYRCASLARLLCFAVDTLGHGGHGVAQFNVFSDIGDTLEVKLRAMQAYETELSAYPDPRSLEALRHTAHRNGAIVGLEAAELFQLVLDVHRW